MAGYWPIARQRGTKSPVSKSRDALPNGPAKITESNPYDQKQRNEHHAELGRTPYLGPAKCSSKYDKQKYRYEEIWFFGVPSVEHRE